MNKNIIKYIAIAILLTPMVSFAEPAPASSPASSPVQSPAPSTGESQSTATAATPSTSESSSTAAPATPSTSDSSSTATPAAPSTGSSTSTASPAIPSTGGSSSTATPATPSTGGSSSTATNSSTPINPPVNPPNGGGSSSSSSSSSGSRAYVYGCPMLTSYLKYGANNDAVQVVKLQSFLSNYEKMNVSVTGIFDKQTENAVTAFQTKYSADIMGPWNKTNGTGYVYITTLKKINNIACSLPLTLSTTEQAIINEVINKSNIAKTNIIVTPNNSNSIEIKGNVDDSTTVLEIEMESENTNVAAVSKPSVINKFWNFIKSLF